MGNRNTYAAQRYDMKLSPLSSLLASLATQPQSLWTFDGIFKLDGSPYSDSSWYYNAETLRTRGGVTSAYSKVHLLKPSSCGDWTIGGVSVTNPPNVNFEQILVLTNGFCGSTCAVTAGRIAAFGNVRTVATGGLAHWQQMSIWSFAGGEVLESSSLNNIARNAGLNPENSPLPAPLPGGASISGCTLREIYPIGSEDYSMPMEFVYTPADYRINVWGPSADSYPHAVSLFASWESTE